MFLLSVKNHETGTTLTECEIEHGSNMQHLLPSENNADTSIISEDGDSSLHEACKGGHLNTVQFLLQKTCNANTCNKDGNSPLSIACQFGYDDIVQLLLKKKANVNLQNED